MFALVIGIIFGIVMAVLVGALFVAIYDVCISTKSENIVLIVGIIACLIMLIGIPVTCVNYDIHCYKS